MLRLPSIAAGAAVLIMSCVNPAAAAPLTNGNFEAGTLAPWTASGTVVIADYNTLPGGGGTSSTFGDFGALFNSGGPANGVLSQAFDTIVNQQYLVTFFFGVYNPSAGTSQTQSLIGTALDGATTLSTTTATDTNVGLVRDPDAILDRFQFSFIATSTTTTLRFADNSVVNNAAGGSDALLDNILVEQVPEVNGATASLPLGFCLMSLLLIQNRRNRLA